MAPLATVLVVNPPAETVWLYEPAAVIGTQHWTAIVAVATAPEPPPPEKLTVGLEVYPEPPLVIVIAPTWPNTSTHVAVAPDPPPPEIVIVGGLVYPLPLAVLLIAETWPVDVQVPIVVSPDMVAVAAAPVPPPPEKVTVGVEVKLPPAVTLTAVTAPPEITATAVAPLPTPPPNPTVGGEVNPVPPAVTATETTCLLVTVTVAPEIAGNGVQLLAGWMQIRPQEGGGGAAQAQERQTFGMGEARPQQSATTR
jgi:hypothetical protein